MKKQNLFLIIATLCFMFCLEKASAIPAFSRKYETSCITCHSVYPKLNAFGQAFRLNGYQFPQDEEMMIKEKRVSLGADAYKSVWPNAIWPNSIPGSVPIALRGRYNYEIFTEDNITSNQFGMPSLQLIAATTVGTDISLFVGAHLYEKGETGSIDRFFVKFSNIFSKHISEKTLNIRVGQFIPDMVPFASNHRSLTTTAYAFNTYDATLGSSFIAGHVHGGGGPFGIENFQLGVEASGVLGERFRYVAGLVNGGGAHSVDINPSKDVYGRLAYKFGGMGFDGSLKEGVDSEFENSFIVGLFGYSGTATHADDFEEYNFHRIGFDFNLTLNNFNLIGGYISGATTAEHSNAYNLYFAEASCMFYPWLVGLVRYEKANPDGLDAVSRVIPHFSALIVANVKLSMEMRLDPNNLLLDNFFFGLDFAF